MAEHEAWTARTRLVAGARPEAPGSPLNVPIVGASNYLLGGPGPAYARSDGTPTWQALESLVGQVEGGSATAFATGMAAIAAVLDTLPLGALVVAPADCYLGTAAHLADGAAAGRWRVSWLDPVDTPAWCAAAEEAELLWLESPTNPLLQVMDLPAILPAGQAAGCLTVVDNTFATPLGQRPLELGADIVVHSATKYLGGHSDLLAGVAVCREAAWHDRIRTRRTLSGATPGMLEAYLAARGMRTLGVRYDRACSNAQLLAERLQEHPAVSRVRYPGLPDDPGHTTASRFMDAFGAMLALELVDAGVADEVCRSLRLIRHATSLGGVESTIERRGAHEGQEHVPGGLLRLSVGCEDVDDLWCDLRDALDARHRRQEAPTVS